MNKLAKFLSLTLILIIVLVGILLEIKGSAKQTQITTTQSSLTIITTNPNNLDGATIGPSQPIEVTFSQPISISDFKYKLDPEIDHDVTVVGGQSSSFGQTFRISFKKPLDLGAAFTLFIQEETKVDDNHRLDHDYIFHVQTIGYSGA